MVLVEVNAKGEKRVLVAEDNSALASVVRFNLERVGFEVSVASNGLEAWELAQANDFDLVVTDQQMPELTGCELCKLLRQTEGYRDVPIIMLTAKGLELELSRLRADLAITPFPVKDGCVHVPKSPGLGTAPEPEVLEHYRTQLFA